MGFMQFQDYLDRRLISFLHSQHRDEAIEALISRLDEVGKLPCRKAFQQAVFQREGLVSTGIGLGVAVPHAKIEGVSDFFIAIGLQQKQGLEWNSLDDTLVRIIFMIGGPLYAQSQYLQILSQLTSLIRRLNIRKALLETKVQSEVIAIFQEAPAMP
jgi:PTS system nitrogen regulatory IIA component